MAQRCEFKGGWDQPGRDCRNQAHGSIGMLKICRDCLADLAGFHRGDPRLKHPITIQLHDDGRPMGATQWLPWRYQKGGDRG